jgi:hypothetical protein
MQIVDCQSVANAYEIQAVTGQATQARGSGFSEAHLMRFGMRRLGFRSRVGNKERTC